MVCIDLWCGNLITKFKILTSTQLQCAGTDASSCNNHVDIVTKFGLEYSGVFLMIQTFPCLSGCSIHAKFFKRRFTIWQQGKLRNLKRWIPVWLSWNCIQSLTFISEPDSSSCSGQRNWWLCAKRNCGQIGCNWYLWNNECFGLLITQEHWNLVVFR